MSILARLEKRALAIHLNITNLDKTLPLFTGELKNDMVTKQKTLRLLLADLRARILVLERAQKLLASKPILHVRFQKFLVSDGMNALLYAPTQVGKTQATKDFIRLCLENDTRGVAPCHP